MAAAYPGCRWLLPYPGTAEWNGAMPKDGGLDIADWIACGATVEDILKAREVINNIYIDDKVKDYIVDMVCCTREPAKYEIEVTDFIQLGASPRATVALTLTAKAHAFLRGRGFVTPQDVKSVAQDVLRHRVSVTFEAEAEEKTSETIIQKILDELPVP